MRSVQLEKMMGFWHVVQYYSSTEETSEYKCMRGELQITDTKEVSSSKFQFLHTRPFDTSCPSIHLTFRFKRTHYPLKTSS